MAHMPFAFADQWLAQIEAKLPKPNITTCVCHACGEPFRAHPSERLCDPCDAENEDALRADEAMDRAKAMGLDPYTGHEYADDTEEF